MKKAFSYKDRLNEIFWLFKEIFFGILSQFIQQYFKWFHNAFYLLSEWRYTKILLIATNFCSYKSFKTYLHYQNSDI